MKGILLVAAASAVLLGSSANQAVNQIADEDLIRSLEAEESAALLRSNASKLDELWDDSLIVNSPLNSVTRKADVLERIRDRSIAYESFEREIDVVLINGDTAIVMGFESGVPAKSHVLNLERIRRRFTNVWMKRDGRWREVARHANLICN